MKNKVFYNVFHKCYKDTRNKVVLAQVEGMTTTLATKSETRGSFFRFSGMLLLGSIQN
ncbi:hypothetical protein [Bacteroides thetaiotaomicron]|uniref:hypothetical protein n=1 Tax=Bacteroides thetaiotaomicron TaxID=818 RepID=UPI0015F6914C|nr:hypothetical protein [Bacteroides thetaiotaomicron]